MSTVDTQIHRSGGLPVWAFMLIASCPVIYLFAMMQMSAITFPFWDHWEQAETIVTYHRDGFWAAITHVFGTVSQHTRPIVVRLVFLFNGMLTRWNVASEYIYVYLALWAGLFVHYRIIRKLARTPGLTAAEALLFSVVAIIYCSPANQNNHYWSWMLQLVLNATLSIITVYIIAFNPRSWAANITAAVLCCLSIYTLTNGLFLIMSVAVMAQLASPRPLRPNAFTAFWLATIVLLFWMYFPIREPGMTAHPQIKSVVHFALMYIGEPIAALIKYPYFNMFLPPTAIWLSTICGAIIGGIGALILLVYRSYLRQPPAHFLFLIGIFLFVGLSAVATGWGRVTFDEFGIRNGNSSRYVITGSMFTIAILYFAFAERDTFLSRMTFGLSDRLAARTKTIALTISYLLFLALSIKCYIDAVPIYTEARDFNRLLAPGFARDASVTPSDMYLYPNQDRLRILRADLLRYRLGPYRDLPATAAP